MGRSNSRTIYVGNLPGDIREKEVEDLFYKYGPIVDIDLKIPPRPPGYAFIEFDDPYDAEDAIDGRDGYDFYGHRLRVELAHGGRGNGHSSSVDRYSSYSSGGGYHGSVSRRSDFRVLVSGLPSNASWQDLKDHMRRAGDVCFSQVFREGRGTTGVVDYTNYDDMKYAIRRLDHSDFRNAFGRTRIRVREYDSRSPSPRSRSRSPRSHSPRRRSRSPRSRSPISSDSIRRSPSRSRSNSLSGSRSRSNSPKVKPSRSSRPRSRSVSSRSRSGSKGRSLSGSRSRSRSPVTSPLRNKRLSISPKEMSPRRSRSISRSRSTSA